MKEKVQKKNLILFVKHYVHVFVWDKVSITSVAGMFN